MAKGILEFQLPEEMEEFKTAQRGGDYKIALEEVWTRVFRPHFKHGYNNEELRNLTEGSPLADKIIELLAEEYHAVVKEYTED